MNKAYLSLGSNLGDRLQYICHALRLLEENAGKVATTSALYETGPWNMSRSDNFINQVILLHTPLQASQLLDCIMGLEKKLGRTRNNSGYEPRTIDIDILLFNDEIINYPSLAVPHPHIATRRFVLEPLCEIAPDLIHPKLQRSVRQLLNECSDVHHVSSLLASPYTFSEAGNKTKL